MNILNFKHLQEVGEGYIEHLRFGLWVAGIQFLLAVMGTIHAILPFLFARWPEKLTNYLVTESRRRTSKVRKSLKSKNVY
jgi:Family of unknown function (DUF6356)